MVSIPAIAYLVIGAGISAYSKFVARTTGDNLVMDIFFYIGLLLVAIGIIKFIFKGLNRKSKEPPKEHKHHEVHPAAQKEEAPTHHQEAAHQHQQAHHHTIIYCSGCGTKNYSTSNFCHKCGKALH
jgi:ABC-type nickel/cobalt efflux system permease component RcnA